MNATHTITENKQRRNSLLVTDPVAPPAQPALNSVVQAICLDAKHDSLKFVLRSNTGHDGE